MSDSTARRRVIVPPAPEDDDMEYYDGDPEDAYPDHSIAGFEDDDVKNAWRCDVCDGYNGQSRLSCVFCTWIKPPPPPVHWKCHVL